MIRQLTNISGNELVLADFQGKVVEVGETFDGLSLGADTLRASADVQSALLNGKLTLNDGQNTYTGSAALDVLKGYATQFTRDGKPITTMSDRPKDHFRCFTGAGDNLATGVRGEGDMLHLEAAAGGSATVECKFVENVYMRDGEIRYLNAGFDTHLQVDVICPANIPFPSLTNTGTLDLVNGSFVPNVTNTGAFMTAPIEVTLFRFINKMHLVGDSSNTLTSPEPFLLNYPYFLRFTLTVDNAIEGLCRAAIMLGMFRTRTV